MSSKKKVLTICNFRGIEQLPSSYNEDLWARLEVELIAIFNSHECSTSLEELYKIAGDLYSQKYSPLFYNLQVLIENHLIQRLEYILSDCEHTLETIDEFWKQFCSQIRTIKNIFLYYDRSPKFFKYNTVQSISLGLFTNVVIFNPLVKNRLIEQMLGKIEQSRTGIPIDNFLLRSTTEMFNALQIYDDIFQTEFLKATQTFYEEEGTKYIIAYDVPQYLALVNKRIIEENARIRDYLNKSTESSLLDIVYKELIKNHMTEILDKGFGDLIKGNMFDELTLIYKLFHKVNDGVKYLITYFKSYIVKKGTAMTDHQNEKNMIQDLLNFKDDLEKIIKTSFENRKEFHECVRLAFKNFINNTQTKAAQLLAKYLDGKLRSREMNDEELEVILAKVIKLFKYIQGKDIFEAFYKRLLAKRLLLNKSSNQDAENSMISKLREECGGAFTSNIEGMFQDMNLSRSINYSFKERMKNQTDNELNSDFSVHVLTNSYWPNYPNYEVNLPLELVKYQQCFQRFYLSKHSGRKLQWQPSLGHCLIKAAFDRGSKELQVSFFQAVVLLLFNTVQELSFKEIHESTNLEKVELKRTLLSLVFGRGKVLLKNPKTQEVNEDDTFTFNGKFANKFYRVKINQVQLQETSEEEKETEKNVLVDRQFQIDAAIVRIMKNKKAVSHNMLVRELYHILDIPVSQTDLKKRIELLIEREYMERDKDNKSNYIYIA